MTSRANVTTMPVQLRLAIVLCIAASPCLEAQTAGHVERPLNAPPRYRVDQWTTVNGLPQNSVNAIAQTPDGNIWVGTFGGLARFDGLRFTAVERTDSTGHHVDRVLSLAAAPDGALWVGTENGLLRYVGGTFRRFGAKDGLPDREI